MKNFFLRYFSFFFAVRSMRGNVVKAGSWHLMETITLGRILTIYPFLFISLVYTYLKSHIPVVRFLIWTQKKFIVF